MRPFKMFFGITVGIILFLFVARIVFVAFIVAAVMSVIYAVYRRLRDFITYDRYGEYYIPKYNRRHLNYSQNNEVEPLFYGSRIPSYRTTIDNVQFINAR